MKQIQMNQSKNLSVNDAYDLFIRKCRVKNLSQASIVSYENKIHPFVDYCEGGLISAVTIDTVDGFTNHLKTEHNVNDVSVVSYLRSVRAFLYYCMECNYMTTFKIHLPKAQKDIKETYSNEQLEKLLAKPDLNSCSFTEFKTWVFENYMLATGNRLSTALNVHIKDIDFDNGMIMLRKTKNRRQQLIPLSASLSEILREYLDIRGGNPDDFLFCNNYGEQASNRTWQTLVYRYNIKHATVDYEIIDRVNKFGDAYEAIYVDNGTIKSKVLDNACSYPVYDDMGEYIAFIEHWTDAYTAISFWNVYYPTYVEHWDNEGGEMRLTSTDNSVGLPIHYHNFNDEDYNFGVALLNDIKPIMDALEDVMAKMSDSIYVNVMNPMPVAIGQRIESSIPADAVGYVMNLDVGDFKYANCSLDYNSIKLYLDNMKQFLNDVACMPSVLGSSTNIANISEVSMQILLMMASVYADENKKWLNIGFQKRFEMFKKILGMQGIKVDSDVEVIYNVAMPVASTEMIANLKTLQEMGAISKETIMEKTEYVSDVEVEKKRLSGENVSQNVSQKVDNPSEEVGIK